MSNYVESKKVLDKIREDFGCKGEIIFRTAIQEVVSYGQTTFLDNGIYKDMIDDIDANHNYAEANGKTLFISRDFEKAIIECARELSKINSYDLLIYIRKEIWLGSDGIDCKRAVQLLESSLEYLENYNNCNNEENYEAFQDIGLEDNEIEELGFGYLISEEEE